VKKIGLITRVLVTSPALLAEHVTPATPSDLSRFPLLHQQDRSGPTAWTLAKGPAALETIEVQPRLATSDFFVLNAAARAGIGIALLPLATCHTELAAGALVRVLPDWGVPEGILHLVFTSRRGMLPSVRAVIDFAADVLRAATD
jgi:DNA-binding transcriptional LysR family regulator